MHTQVSKEFDEERRLNDELDDREAFEYELFQTSQLRVCACCGQERNGLLIPDKVLLPTNNLDKNEASLYEGNIFFRWRCSWNFSRQSLHL